MRGIDTNVLVRYLVKDDLPQYRAAAAFFDSAREAGELRLDAIVLCELTWVLRSSYGCPREELADILEKLLSTEQIEVEDADAAWLALEDFRASKADFADCLIGRRNRSAGCTMTVTFDERLKPLASFEVLATGGRRR